jgi:hypothetical protein
MDEQINYENIYCDIDTLPFTSAQKEIVLEYLAMKLWKILLKTQIMDDCCKTYDPLIIEGHIAHSYVFDMEDGGRHHPFKDYKHLEQMLMEETILKINEALSSPCGDCDCD